MLSMYWGWTKTRCGNPGAPQLAGVTLELLEVYLHFVLQTSGQLSGQHCTLATPSTQSLSQQQLPNCSRVTCAAWLGKSISAK